MREFFILILFAQFQTGKEFVAEAAY